MSSGDDSSDAADALPPTASATEALENAVEESRREYDKKVETMEEIDDKAMRSVRTAVISVGLVVSAVSVSGPSAISEFNALPIIVGTLGIVALVVSIVYGIGAYSTTEFPTGIHSGHRKDVINGGYSDDEWFVNMLDQYDEWSDKLTKEVAKNTRYLELVQFTLSFGVIALLVSASLIVMKSAYGIRPVVTFVVAFSCLLVIRTYLGDKDERLP